MILDVRTDNDTTYTTHCQFSADKEATPNFMQ